MKTIMKTPGSILVLGIAAALLVGTLGIPTKSSGQAAGDEQALAQLVAEIAAQQAKIVANQQAIDQKIAAIEENMRVARIFVSRGGGKK